MRKSLTVTRGRKSRKSKNIKKLDLHSNLRILFSPKQKELVLKRLKGEKFTKTDREYYSRVVKKKLSAIANSEIRRVAALLTK